MANPLHIFLPFSISKQPKHLTADTQVTVVQLIQESSQQHANFWHNPTQAYGTCTERYHLSPHLANSLAFLLEVSALAVDTQLHYS